MYYRAYINFCIEWYVKNSKKNNNNNNNNFFFAVHSVLVTIYPIYLLKNTVLDPLAHPIILLES